MVDAHECGSRAGFDVPKRHVAATTFSKSKRSGDFKQKSCMAKNCLIEIEKSDSTGAGSQILKRPPSEAAASSSIVAMLNRSAIRADGRTLTIIGKNELANSRRQIAVLVYHFDRGHKARDRLLPSVGNFLQCIPKLILKTYAGLVMGDHD
jgi:hypothetical protein